MAASASTLSLFMSSPAVCNRFFENIRPSSYANGKRLPFTCFSSKKKQLSLVDQILDYIEGGPKLRKWYGAPDLIEKER